MSTFLCRLLYVNCSMSTALCRLLYVNCSMSTALCQLLYVNCSMSTALCRAHNALCRAHNALCRLHNALCRLHNALCQLLCSATYRATVIWARRQQQSEHILADHWQAASVPATEAELGGGLAPLAISVCNAWPPLRFQPVQ